MKVYDPKDSAFLIQLINELVAIPVRSRGEAVALSVASRDLAALSEESGAAHKRSTKRR